MKKFSLKLLITFSMIAVIFIGSAISPLNKANADVDQTTKELEVVFENAEKFEETYSGIDSVGLTAMKDDLKRLLAKKEIKLGTHGTLDFTKVSGKMSEDHSLIYLPINYKNVENEMNKSFFTAGFKEGKLEFYYEVKIVGDNKKYTSEIELVSNGKLLNKQKLQLSKEDFNTEPQKKEVSTKSNSMLSLLQPQTAEAGWWSNFNDCLSSQGIAGWAITSLSVICGFACIGSAGAGCVPCLLGAGLLTEGVIAYCIGMAGM
ncbi:hypothetical protein [Planomicrobium sp. CPCC 101079]|uniref:hypothetical protein n=1 Tax=Planomicrobium sp. CPCC 101079 TaxID=2599618 RepID=UPI0011B5FAD7|nr:hypothetical protein [Planomicrobium sp. CPCC 101079]TWT03615.1 hypothetical protein FQV28_11390 [Planomicrobium sp. CPCC 101079]